MATVHEAYAEKPQGYQGASKEMVKSFLHALSMDYIFVRNARRDCKILKQLLIVYLRKWDWLYSKVIEKEMFISCYEV